MEPQSAINRPLRMHIHILHRVEVIPIKLMHMHRNLLQEPDWVCTRSTFPDIARVAFQDESTEGDHRMIVFQKGERSVTCTPGCRTQQAWEPSQKEGIRHTGYQMLLRLCVCRL